MPTKPLPPAELAAIKAANQDTINLYRPTYEPPYTRTIAALLDEVERLRGAIVAAVKPLGENQSVHEWDIAWLSAQKTLSDIAGETTDV